MRISGVVTYDGLDRCILSSQPYKDDNPDVFSVTDPYDEARTSCSSSKDVFGFESFCSDWTTKRDNEKEQDWGEYENPWYFVGREKSEYNSRISDVKAMKEKFAKLLLGEDVTGGCKGISSALAISNAITDLAANVFGELRKLEPLQEEKKAKWKKEIDWLLSPANYMVKLVPAKQNGVNGLVFEIMTPKPRSDIDMNLPTLRKLDAMLIEALDSMVNTEYWYVEGNSREKSGRQSKKWCIPTPRVPAGGLSETARKKLRSLGNVVQQIFKAAKAINEDFMHKMPVPKAIHDVLPKSGKACLGEELYKVLSSESNSTMDIIEALKLRNEHEVLDTINKLETAKLVWNKRIKDQAIMNSRTLVSASWPFLMEQVSELEKIKSTMIRVDALLCEMNMRYPCLPHTFIDVTKIQHGKDIGHSILEAYSRVLGNLAYNILSRIGDILQEDYSSNPNSTIPSCYLPSGFSLNGITFTDSPISNVKSHITNSNVNRMNKNDGYFSDSNQSRTSYSDISVSTDTKLSSSVTATPSSSRIWCIAKDPYSRGSLDGSP